MQNDDSFGLKSQPNNFFDESFGENQKGKEARDNSFGYDGEDGLFRTEDGKGEEGDRPSQWIIPPELQKPL
jgi:hypothetical protein